MTGNGRFFSPTKGELPPEEVVRELVGYLAEDVNSTYRLVIGTDSKDRPNNGHREIDFVTAVVIHRQGKGARYFWKKMRDIKEKSLALRYKIHQETWLSLQLAEELVPQLKEQLLKEQLDDDRYSLEIHIDVGEVGPTREMIKEVVGMVTGNGYTAKTKPESFGASSVADRHT